MGKKLLGSLMAASGIGGAYGLDYLQHPGEGHLLSDPKSNSRWRWGNAGINSAFLGSVPLLFAKNYPAAAAVMMGSPFSKDLMVAGLPLVNKMRENEGKKGLNALLAAGIGVGALGLGGAGLNKYIKSKNEDKARVEQGELSVILPTKDPGDGETKMTMSVPKAQLSEAMLSKVHRDVRKRLRSENRERTMKRDPKKHKLIPFDKWQEQYGESKAATESIKNIKHLADNLWL